ncbi:MAG: hypothetical protein QOE70_6671 [Chthoniobacter sp.]|jgi:hypothetical protein|nr:hypothetical protein [Chthoniobacter sp.]
MKYLAILAAILAACFVLARELPLEPVKQAIVQSEAAPLVQGGRTIAPGGVTALKRPLDRTQAVLEQVKARNGDGVF